MNADGRPQLVHARRRGSAAGVLVSTAGFLLGMWCLYLVMRDVGIENGGSCASGGPYEIREGQECGDGVFGLATVGILGAMIATCGFLWSSHRYGGSLVTTAASGAAFSGFFGGLGASFLAVSGDLPSDSPDGSEFAAVGIVFLVMAAAALPVVFGPAVYSVRSERRDIARPPLRAWGIWFALVVVGAGIGFALSLPIDGP